jgi:hypothetical protein
MKTTLIKLNDQHYIVVDDSEIKEGDWVCNIQRPYIKQCQDIDVDYYNKRNDVFKKITHSTEPLEYKYGSQKHGFNMGVMSSDIKLVYDQIKPLDLSEVEELINGYSVEKMSYEATKKQLIRIFSGESAEDIDDDIQKRRYYYELGFNAHKELVKDKLFTVENIEQAMIEGLTIEQFWEKCCKSLLPKTEWLIKEITPEGKIILL